MKTNLLLILFFLLEITFSAIINAQITPANNVISVDLTTPQDPGYTYDSAIINCSNLGMKNVGLHFLWKSGLESTPSIFNLTNLDIANIYYPTHFISIDLNIDPIETNTLELPIDISSLTFDDPIVINRFKILLDSVFAHIPDLQLSSLIIGSEVDGYLGTDPTKWAQYTTFYSAVSSYAKSIKPGLKVACEAMLPGLTGAAATFLQTLNVFSDYIGVSYYPINGDFTVKPTSIVSSDFLNVVNLYPSKPIYFYQLGYPSSSLCNSSETLQAQFIETVFQIWDLYSTNIKLIDFTWLHDWSSSAISYWSTYYGISDPVFLDFLGSIGLRNWGGSGADKPAFKELICQAKQRNYNSLPMNCSADIQDEKKQFSFYINTLENTLTILNFTDLENVEISIYNQIGQTEKTASNITSKDNTFDLGELANGVYFIVIQNQNIIYKNKFTIGN